MAKSPPPPHLHEPLGVLLGTRAKVGLLRILTALGEPLSQRELARRAGLTLRSAQQALADLYAMGVVTQIAGGRDHLSVFNTRHMLGNALSALFAAESELARQLRAELVRVSTGDADPPIGVYLFGSVARADETLESDVDVLLIARDTAHRDALLDRVLGAVAALKSVFGVRVAPLAFAKRDARRGWAAKHAPWPEIARDVVPVFGPSLAELLR